MLKLCVLYEYIDAILKLGWELYVLASVTQGGQYIFAQLLDILLEHLQLFGVLFTCLR